MVETRVQHGSSQAIPFAFQDESGASINPTLLTGWSFAIKPDSLPATPVTFGFTNANAPVGAAVVTADGIAIKFSLGDGAGHDWDDITPGLWIAQFRLTDAGGTWKSDLIRVVVEPGVAT